MKLRVGQSYIARNGAEHVIADRHGFQSYYESGGLSWHENGWVHGGFGEDPRDLIAHAAPDFGTFA